MITIYFGLTVPRSPIVFFVMLLEVNSKMTSEQRGMKSASLLP